MHERKHLNSINRINPIWRLYFGRFGVAIWSPWLDYVVATANKPDDADNAAPS
jgi:hypothetical protein